MTTKEHCQKSIDEKTEKYYNILNKKDIIKFTYEDYLKCLEQKKRQENSTLNEDSIDYEVINGRKTNHNHDKTYRKLLSNKEDAAHIINEALKLEKEDKVVEEELEKYNTNFITNEFKDRQADIVYKIKDRDIFFLIEHQSKVDYFMAYRIEEYKLAIINSAIDMKKAKTKGYEIPTVIPIVIYTGKGKWRARLYLNDVKEKRFKNIDLLKYNLIDINEYEKEKLLNSGYLIDKMFLIDKSKNVEEFIKSIEEAIAKTKSEKDKIKLIKMIEETIRGKIEYKKVEELIKKMKGGKESMISGVNLLVERAIEKAEELGMERGMERGMEKGIQRIISSMIQKGMKVEEIKDLTGLSKEEIEKILIVKA